MGFFADAHFLFVIGIASALILAEWHRDSAGLTMRNTTMLAAVFLGALVFGRLAFINGRKRVYWLVAMIVVATALGSAL
jgi:MFS family permease